MFLDLTYRDPNNPTKPLSIYKLSLRDAESDGIVRAFGASRKELEVNKLTPLSSLIN